MQKWRKSGIGPKFIKFGVDRSNRAVRYPMDEILKFERDRMFAPLRKP